MDGRYAQNYQKINSLKFRELLKEEKNNKNTSVDV
jgi:hypothetical protein